MSNTQLSTNPYTLIKAILNINTDIIPIFSDHIVLVECLGIVLSYLNRPNIYRASAYAS
jgi:hypothetical protein